MLITKYWKAAKKKKTLKFFFFFFFFFFFLVGSSEYCKKYKRFPSFKTRFPYNLMLKSVP